MNLDKQGCSLGLKKLNKYMSLLQICCPVLGIDPESNSGGGVHDRELLKALAEEGAEIEILLPKNRPHNKNIKNWHIEYTPITHIFPPYLFNIFVLPYLFKEYKEKKFNCIRIFNPYFAGPAVYIFKKIHPDVPVIAMYHHLEDNRIMYLMDKFLINTWDKIITPSEFTKKEIIDKFKIPPNKIVVLYSGVVGKYHPSEKKLTLIEKYQLKDKIIFLFLGGLKKRKNVSFLIDLLKEIKEKNTALLICGSGDEKVALETKVKLLGLENQVKFTGFIEENEKNDYYNLADIVLFPTIKEGFGLLPLEAGLCGKPTIASDIASIPEVIIDNQTGILAETNDKRDWLSKINILIHDKKLRSKLGNNALKYSLKMQSEKFNWNIIAKKYLKIYANELHKK